MLYGAVLLTLGSIAMRCVQLLFQVYISGVMGAQGLGRMQLILTVGNFGAILASGGVRMAAACLCAQETGYGRVSGVRTALRCCFLYGLVLSTLVAAALFLLAQPIARVILQDDSTALALRLLAVFLPVGCLGSVLSGYYTAAGRITELVAVELGERVAGVGLVYLLLQSALDPCLAILLGTSLAGLGCLIILGFRYYGSIRAVACQPIKPMLRRLFSLALPLGLGDILRSGLGALENILVPKGLEKNGLGQDQALSGYGTLGGMVFPVITFPSVILYSLSDLLVPEMARCQARDRQVRIRFLTDKCLRLSLLFAMGWSGLFFLLGEDLGNLLFGSREAGVYIRIFAPLIPILYVDAITDGILKGLSQQVHSVRYNTITSILDVTLLVVLLPTHGLGGFLAAFTVSHGVNFFLSLRRLILVTGYLPTFRTTLLGAVSCALALGGIWLLPDFGGLGGILWRGGGFLLLFAALAYLSGAVQRQDLRWLRSLVG
jgi:stage V sporulation protein B